MKKYLILFLLLIPAIAFAEWSQPVWTDDCTVVVEKDEKGRIKTWTETCTGEDGKQTSKRIDAYTYHQNGDVNEIQQKVYGPKTMISNQKVKHTTDGKQPTVEILNTQEAEVIK